MPYPKNLSLTVKQDTARLGHISFTQFNDESQVKLEWDEREDMCDCSHRVVSLTEAAYTG